LLRPSEGNGDAPVLDLQGTENPELHRQHPRATRQPSPPLS
jgi:hypothetical protein